MVSQLTKTPLQVANPEQLERIRHTCAHVMAMAVQILFPETKVTIGPTTDTGFYYDLDRPQPFTPEDLTNGSVERLPTAFATTPRVAPVRSNRIVRLRCY